MFVCPNILRNYDSFLNWTFSSPNMVRTVQTLLHSQLAWNEMQAFGPNLRQTRSRQHDRKCRLKSSQVKSIYLNHPSQGNSTNYYLILGLRDKAAPSTSPQINKFPPKRVKNLATPSCIFFFPFIHRRANQRQSEAISASQRQWSSNRANVPRTCWAKIFGPRI